MIYKIYIHSSKLIIQIKIEYMIMRSIKFAIRKGLKFESFNENGERQKSKNDNK